jgi:hypothetical protein
MAWVHHEARGSSPRTDLLPRAARFNRGPVGAGATCGDETNDMFAHGPIVAACPFRQHRPTDRLTHHALSKPLRFR